MLEVQHEAPQTLPLYVLFANVTIKVCSFKSEVSLLALCVLTFLHWLIIPLPFLQSKSRLEFLACVTLCIWL